MPKSLEWVSEQIMHVCNANPGTEYTTPEIILAILGEQPYPEDKRQIYRLLSDLGNMDFPYVSKGAPKRQLLYGREQIVKPNLWQAPPSGPTAWLPKGASSLVQRVEALEAQIAALRESVAKLQQRGDNW